MGVVLEPAPATAPSAPAIVPTSRPIVRATAPERYRVQFAIGEDTHEKLRRVQALLRREIPDGDPGKICFRGAEVNSAPLIWRVRFASAGVPSPYCSSLSKEVLAAHPLEPPLATRE
jgi:hypothetical protein